MADDSIKYSDIVQPDDSLNNLIKLLGETNQQYTALASGITSAVEKIGKSLEKQSGATKKGKKAIKEASEELSTYEKLLIQLDNAISETGAKEAWLRERIKEVNKQTVDQEKYTRQLEGSYERLVTDLKNSIATFKAMSPEMRMNADQGMALVKTIHELQARMLPLDALLKDHVTLLTRARNAERDLAFAQSDEGKQAAIAREATRQANKETIEAAKLASNLTTEQERLKIEIRQLEQEYGRLRSSLSAAEQQQYIDRIVSLKKQLQALKDEVKATIPEVTKLQKAQQDLAFAQSDEGKQTAIAREELRKQNAETLEAAKLADTLTTEQERLKIQIKQLEREYGVLRSALSATERQQYISQITGLKAQLRALKDELKLVTPEVTRLQKAQQELAFAQSDEGKQAAIAREEMRRTNQATVEAERWANTLTNSYSGIEIQLKAAIKQYKEFSSALPAGDPTRQAAVQTIINLRAQLRALKEEMALTTPEVTKLQRAEAELAYLMGPEGEAFLQTRNEIRRLTAAKRELKDINIRLAEAQAKLNIAERDENVALHETEGAVRRANEVARWQAQLNTAAVGSYKALEAQYNLNMIKLRELSGAEYEAARASGGLVQQTQDLYNAMKSMQEATGNYIRNVGNYRQVWNGLGFSITQVVREIPNAAISMHTFFMAISNNVPMIIDEVRKIRIENEALIRAGKKTKSVWAEVGKSLFSFNTALTLAMTALILWGKDLVEWLGTLGDVRGKVMSIAEAMGSLSAQLGKQADEYAKNRTSLAKLATEWKSLTSDKEKLQFIKDNKTAFDRLDVSVNNVADAENLLVKNTEGFITAMKLRAKAAAATALAQEQYGKALQAEAKAMNYTDKKGKIKSEEDLKEAISEMPWLERLAFGFTDIDWKRELLSSIPFPIPGAPRIFLTKDIDYTQKATKRVENLKKDVKQAEDNAQQFIDIFDAYMNDSDELLKKLGLDSAHKQDRTRTRQPRDLTNTIMRNEINIRKKYEASVTNLIQEEYTKRRKALEDSAENELNILKEQYRKNLDYLENANGKYKELTEEQKAMVLKQQSAIIQARLNIEKKLNHDLAQLEKERQVNTITTLRETLDWSIERLEESINKERDLRIQQLDDDMRLELETNKERDAYEIIVEYSFKKQKVFEEYNQQVYKIYEADINNRLELVKQGSEEELKYLLEQNEIARKIALSANRAKPAAERLSEAQINASFDQKGKLLQGTTELANYDAQAAASRAEFEIAKHTQDKITAYTLKAEQDRLKFQLQLVKQGMLKWSDAQVKEAESTVKKIDRELSELNNWIAKIGRKGLGATLLESLGLNDEQISALETAVNTVVDNLKEILDAEVELAEKMAELAQKRVDAAQSAYDAEIEARNNGYAHNVATAKKELEQEKKRQREKQKILAAAQRRQEALNSISQASSLVTASALIWSQLGFPWAIPALAVMWGSFAAAKIKANQVSKQSETLYGDGGLEFLEGGSHASGNDIDLQTTNRKGRNMRAEGGEALAVINKRQTRRYKKFLPDIIDSLNKGNFEDKYLQAFDGGQAMSIAVNSSPNIDLSKLESEVSSIRKQNENKYYILPNGDTVVISGNVKRIIRK